jgi:hypothetical protein
MEIAAWIAAALLVVLTVFQLALALGAPAGAAAWGGGNPGVLPTRLRVVSALVAVFVYPPITLLILDSGDAASVGWNVNRLWMWVLTGLFALGTFSNFASRSRIERIVWGPVSLVIAICCAIIAIGM